MRQAKVHIKSLLLASANGWRRHTLCGMPSNNACDHEKEVGAMAIPHAKPGELVDVRPLGSLFGSTPTTTLVRAKDFEMIRLVVPAGKEIDEHKAKGELIVHCLEGQVAFTAFGKTQTLEAGKLLYLPTGELHSVKGIENASLLLTILLPTT